ncbi:MAG: DsbA family oxidoreductase [Rhizobiaceae bacterium]|nr:DsbA family oxidoreductase [Rhizobiaceae bacterium]MCV0406378.1 DsbA family oxidoreductase [Rhizobiaceae bacterium]
MSGFAPISIDVVSDVVCPWCYVGQKRLEAALENTPEVEVDLRCRPYQLDPSIPPGGVDRKQYMLAKFGSEERLKDLHAQISEAGRSAGIAFAFDKITVSPNTLDAHRLLRWAGPAGDGIQNALNKRLFQLYFEQGRDIGARAVLVEAAREVGMDASVVEALLPTEADVEAVTGEIETAQRMGIRGVPCYLLEGKYAVMGAQDATVLADAVRQVSSAKDRGELDPAEG